jgi:hypothetical protein
MFHLTHKIYIIVLNNHYVVIQKIMINNLHKNNFVRFFSICFKHPLLYFPSEALWDVSPVNAYSRDLPTFVPCIYRTCFPRNISELF